MTVEENHHHDETTFNNRAGGYEAYICDSAGTADCTCCKYFNDFRNSGFCAGFILGRRKYSSAHSCDSSGYNLENAFTKNSDIGSIQIIRKGKDLFQIFAV